MKPRFALVFLCSHVLGAAVSFTSAAVIDPVTGAPDPSDPGVKLWLDASDPATVFQDTAGTVPASTGMPVARWDDKSMSGIIVTQPNAANTPAFSASVANFNNLPAISFIGGDGGDALTSTTGNSTGIFGAAPMTVVTVWQTKGYTSQNYQHSFHMGDTVNLAAYGHSVSRATNAGEVSNHYWGDGYNSAARVGLDVPSFAISTYDGADDRWYVNGLYLGRRTISLNIGTSQLQIGSRLSPFVEGFTGDIAEVVVFDQVLSADDQEALTRYLSGKYAIELDTFPEGPGEGGVNLATGKPDPNHPALKLWLDASDPATLWQDVDGTIPAGDGMPVARWDDKSMGGIIVTQPSAANTPVFSASVVDLNDSPAVTFTGGTGGDALTSTTGNSTGITGLAELTMVTVWQNTGFTAQNYQHTVQIGNPTTSSAYGHSSSRAGDLGSGIGNHYWDSGFDNTAVTANLNANMALSSYDRSIDRWYVNGIPGGEYEIFLAIGGNELQIGSRLQPFIEGFSGHLAEVILFCTVLSEAERNALGFYIQEKYGITVQDAALTGSFEIVSVDYGVDAAPPDTAHVSFTWTSRAGAEYLVEYSSDLLSWDELDDAYPSDGELTTFTDTFGMAASVLRRYYRVSER